MMMQMSASRRRPGGTQPPISCAYALNASEATLQGFGLTGRLTMSNSDQTMDYLIQGGLGAQEVYGAAANPGTTLDASTGNQAFCWLLTTIPTLTTGTGLVAQLRIYDAALSQALYALGLFCEVNGTHTLVINNASGQIYGSTIAVPSFLSLRFDATNSLISIAPNGITPLVLSDNTFTPQAIFPLFEVVEVAAVDASYAGQSLTMSLETSASNMSGADLSGATDFCGNAIA